MSRNPVITHLQGELASQAGRQRLLVLGVSFALCLFSLAWGLSGEGRVDRNPLGASAEAQVSRAGSIFLVVANGSSSDWESVRFVADDRWYLHVPRVGSLEQVDLRMDTFSDAWRIPRARGTERWEDLLPPDAQHGTPPSLQPERLRIETGGVQVLLHL